MSYPMTQAEGMWVVDGKRSAVNKALRSPLDQRQHLAFGVSVDEEHMVGKPGMGHGCPCPARGRTLSRGFDGMDVLFEEARLFPGFGHWPRPNAAWCSRTWRWQRPARTGGHPVPADGAAAVVKVQVGQKDIRDVVPVESKCIELCVEVFVARGVVPKELLALLVAHAAIDEHQAVAVLMSRSAARSHRVHGGVVLGPEGLRHNAEHGASVELEQTMGDRVQVHAAKVGVPHGCAVFGLAGVQHVRSATLNAISPIDGRYRRHRPPRRLFSEAGLIQYQVRVEIEYLIACTKSGSRNCPHCRMPKWKDSGPSMWGSARPMRAVKDWTTTTTSRPLSISSRTSCRPRFEDRSEFVHFGLTSRTTTPPSRCP